MIWILGIIAVVLLIILYEMWKIKCTLLAIGSGISDVDYNTNRIIQQMDSIKKGRELPVVYNNGKEAQLENQNDFLKKSIYDLQGYNAILQQENATYRLILNNCTCQPCSGGQTLEIGKGEKND